MGILDTALRDAIVRQVDKYGPMLEKTVQQKVYLYCRKFDRYLRDSISLCWMKTYYKIRELVNKGVLAEVPLATDDTEGTWLIMPNYLWEDGSIPDDVSAEVTDRIEIIRRWREAIDGHYAESIVARAFRDQGFSITTGAIMEDSAGNKLEIDVLAIREGITYAVEVKNRYSECFHPPISKEGLEVRATEQQRKIWDFFPSVATMGWRPILVACFADRSLTGWVRKFNGKYMNLLYQILPKDNNEIVSRLGEKFKLGHVKCFEDPPENLLGWIETQLD